MAAAEVQAEAAAAEVQAVLWVQAAEAQAVPLAPVILAEVLHEAAAEATADKHPAAIQ